MKKERKSERRGWEVKKKWMDGRSSWEKDDDRRESSDIFMPTWMYLDAKTYTYTHTLWNSYKCMVGLELHAIQTARTFYASWDVIIICSNKLRADIPRCSTSLLRALNCRAAHRHMFTKAYMIFKGRDFRDALISNKTRKFSSRSVFLRGTRASTRARTINDIVSHFSRFLMALH